MTSANFPNDVTIMPMTLGPAFHMFITVSQPLYIQSVILLRARSVQQSSYNFENVCQYVLKSRATIAALLPLLSALSTLV